ncbi:MAG TPA: Fe-S cluster assembly protein SufD [Gemmatimonadaceae bacterium]|nr:Fe-S cluster assembly protein SufD [Gemmatimonadaceae bacterium]
MTGTTKYAEAFAALEGAGSAPSWLADLRKAAHAEFSAIGFPTTRNEDWHFTSVTPIAERTFRLPKAPAAAPADLLADAVGDASWPRAVFVNGRFEPSLSSLAGSGDARVMTLAAALKDAPDVLSAHLGRLAAWNAQAFTALNTAFAQDGIVVHVPRGAKVAAPLHIVHAVDAQAAGAMLTPRLLVIVEPLAEFAIVENYLSQKGIEYFTNAVGEAVVGTGGRFHHYKVQRESREAFHVGTMQVTQGRDSLFHSFSYASGAALSRTNIYTKLAGDGAEVRLNGLYLVDGSQHADHQTFVEHIAPGCASRELYKGILDGDAHGVFNGKVFVDPQAQKTDGKQTNHALLLSPAARVDTKPQLEIFADDVKCTHGATVGRLDELALFYLKSRGVGAENARALLTYAFAAEVLETVELDALRDGLERIAFERFTHTEQR